MRICPVCPVMEIIVPVDVTDVEQEVVRVLWDLQDQLLRQYMHNTEIAVTMRLSTILKTIKQPL